MAWLRNGKGFHLNSRNLSDSQEPEDFGRNGSYSALIASGCYEHIRLDNRYKVWHF